MTGTVFQLTMLVWWQLQRKNSLMKLIQMAVGVYFSIDPLELTSVSAGNPNIHQIREPRSHCLPQTSRDMLNWGSSVASSLSSSYTLWPRTSISIQESKVSSKGDSVSQEWASNLPHLLIWWNIRAVKDMDGENAECLDILELTMTALNNDTLKWLLATVQEVNIRLRITQMLRRYEYI